MEDLNLGDGEETVGGQVGQYGLVPGAEAGTEGRQVAYWPTGRTRGAGACGAHMGTIIRVRETAGFAVDRRR